MPAAEIITRINSWDADRSSIRENTGREEPQKKLGMITIPGFLTFRCFMTSAFLLYKPVRYFPVRKTAGHTRGNGAHGGTAQSCVYSWGKEHTNMPDRE